jgi:hypothetical protein
MLSLCHQMSKLFCMLGHHLTLSTGDKSPSAACASPLSKLTSIGRHPLPEAVAIPCVREYHRYLLQAGEHERGEAGCDGSVWRRAHQRAAGAHTRSRVDPCPTPAIILALQLEICSLLHVHAGSAPSHGSICIHNFIGTTADAAMKLHIRIGQTQGYLRVVFRYFLKPGHLLDQWSLIQRIRDDTGQDGDGTGPGGGDGVPRGGRGAGPVWQRRQPARALPGHRCVQHHPVTPPRHRCKF